MREIKISKIEELETKHKNEHPEYEYYRKTFIPRGYGERCMAAVYELPPLKASYPYHYHHKNEEIFYIISGEGILKTPEGERKVKTGDLLYFPANESGAHKLTNSSKTSNLVYLDFDAISDLDVAEYPDSNKIGVYGKNIYKIFNKDDDKDYYDGE